MRWWPGFNWWNLEARRLSAPARLLSWPAAVLVFLVGGFRSCSLLRLLLLGLGDCALRVGET